MKTAVEFRSDRFGPYEGEEAEVNPGRYGKRLAEFLVQGLQIAGFRCEQPIAEDWGWVVRVDNKAFPLWIGCGNSDEYPNGFLCFIEPHKPIIRRFFRAISTQDRVESLRQAIHDLLSNDDGIRDVRWLTHDELMQGI